MGSFWSKLLFKRQTSPTQRRTDLAKELDVPVRTLNYRIAQQDKRLTDETAHFLESEAGELFLKRLVVGTIYTFCIKGGVGAGRVEEFFHRIKIYSHVGISESSILRMLRQIEQSIMMYKSLQDEDLAASGTYAEELQVSLGIDETWLDEMLLVCQDLISGYIFLRHPQPKETP